MSTHENTTMKIILFGAPGSGKGTQAKALSDMLNIKAISLGDILRAEVKRETSLGNKVKNYMHKGLLVPDSIVEKVVEETLCGDGFILDGYPRNLAQAEHLAGMFKERSHDIDMVIYLEIDEATALRRLESRRVCKECGAIFHLVTMPPRTAGVCDVCGGALVQRPDDTSDVIRERLAVFLQESKPLLDFYRNQDKLVCVDARGDKDDVFADLKRLIHERSYSHS